MALWTPGNPAIFRGMGSVAAMGIYAKRPARMIGQLFGDGFVLLWTVGWAIIGIFVHRVIEILAVPARETARTATRLAENFREAAAEAAKVPVAGEQLRRPFDAASVTLGNLITSANDQVTSIERLALIVGWLVFLILAAASDSVLSAGSGFTGLFGCASRPRSVCASGHGRPAALRAGRDQ